MEEKREQQGKNRNLWKLLFMAAAIYVFVRFFLPLLLPFVLAYFLAELVTPAAKVLKKYLHLPVAFGGAVLILAAIAGLGTGIFFLGRLIVGQTAMFFQNAGKYWEYFTGCSKKVCCFFDEWFCMEAGTAERFLAQGLADAERKVREGTVLSLSGKMTGILRFFAAFFAEAVVTFAAAVLLLGYREHRGRHGAAETEENRLFVRLAQVKHQLYKAGAAYLKTEFLLGAMVAVVCGIGIFFVKREYAVILGIVIAVLDALPVIGSGCVLVPWCIISIVQGDFISAAVLFVTYVICILIRELLEPRLLGNKIGIPPLYTLMAVYLGVKLFGICGVVLGPLCLLILRYTAE